MKPRPQILIGVTAALLVCGLVWALTAYAGAVGRAELLSVQLEGAMAENVVLMEAREVAVATTDSIVAKSDSVIAASEVAVAEAQATTDRAVADSEAAFRNAVALADSNPVLERAIEEMRAEQIVETMAWEDERAEHLAAADAMRQQLRTVQTAFARERAAWIVETDGLREALGLSEQESAAWERAAKPGLLRQVWQQGRVAVAVASVILAVR